MAANTMNFGPEWMRPAKPAGSAQPTIPMVGPSRDHPAFKAANFIPRPRIPVQRAEYTETDTSASGGDTEPMAVKFAPPLDSLPPAPFRYTSEFMLSLFNDKIDIPESEFERHEVVLSEETLPPVATLALTEQEETIMASGSVNSEITRRMMQQGSRGGRGGRGARNGTRSSFGSSRTSNPAIGSEEGFRNFVSRAQVSEEPAWNNNTAASNRPGSFGHFDAQGVFHFENVDNAGAAGRGAGVAGRSGSNNGGAFRGGRLPDLATVAAEFTLAQQAQQIASATAGGIPGVDNPEETLWFYRDPQGNTQGPFTGLDMHEWYKAGFFTANLLVRREGDADFEPLGHLVQLLGNDEMPFLLPSPRARLPASFNPQTPPVGSLVDRASLGWTEEEYLRELEREKDRSRQQMDRQRLVHVLQQRQNGPVSPVANANSQPISRGYQSDLLAKLNQQSNDNGHVQVDQLAASMHQLDVNGAPLQ